MLRHWLQLSLTDGIGPILARRVIEAAGDVESACNVTIALLRNVEGIGIAKASHIHESLRASAAAVDSEIERARRMGISILCPDDQTYPALIRTIADPPLALYMKGTLEPRDLNALAIVGSRKCSFYGREQAERFGALLAGSGFTVISGGARGIDTAAHRGAMSHPQGRTIAVLGSGVDVPYPPENDALFEQIARRGAVISEFPLGTPPNRENFPRRNRVVSGMSRGVIVVEADEKSGALITARVACDDHDRPVFAIPGRVDNPLSAGPHLLIRDGATLVAKLDDILEGLGPVPQGATEPTLFADEAAKDLPAPARAGAASATAGMTDRQALVLSHLGADATPVDAIIERTALPAHVVLQELTFLSLKGQVRRVDGQTFAPGGCRGHAGMNVRYDMVTCYVVRPTAGGALGEFLQLRRAKGEFLEGVWGPVHGRIERGETAWQAALRELREETGITPAEFYQLDTINQFYLVEGDCVWHVPGFCAVVPHDATVALNEEHDDYRWIDRSRIDRDFLWPGERRQVEELSREILDDGPAKSYLRIKLP